MKIREIKSEDKAWIKNLFIKRWAGDFIVSRRKIHRLDDLKGFIAESNNKKVGLITFGIKDKNLEIISLDSLLERRGIGSTLLKKVIDYGKRKKIKRIFLTTTNDNFNALRFYQKRKFRLVKVFPNSMEFARRLKPKIPKISDSGVPIRDEIELEIKL